MLKSHGIEVAFPVICQSKSALFFRNGKNAPETDRESGMAQKRDRRVVDFPTGPEKHHRLRMESGKPRAIKVIRAKNRKDRGWPGSRRWSFSVFFDGRSLKIGLKCYIVKRGRSRAGGLERT